MFIKKVFSGIFTILLIATIVFAMFQVIPGNPVLSKLGADQVEENPELAEKLYQEFQLDKPVLLRYKNWMLGILKGDLGNSFRYGQPVNSLIKERLDVTLILTLFSIILTIAVALPLGIYISNIAGSERGVAINIISQLGLAIPSFWLAIVLMWIFSYKLGLLPTRVIIDWHQPLATLRSLIMPVIVMSVGNISIIIRYLTNSIAEEKVKDYVVLAKSKGIEDNKILKKHIFKNISISMLTILGMVIINLMMGSILVENVFNIQGIGSLLIGAIRENDYPISQGVILLYSILVVFINMILDIIYLWIDPRIDTKRRVKKWRK